MPYSLSKMGTQRIPFPRNTTSSVFQTCIALLNELLQGDSTLLHVFKNTEYCIDSRTWWLANWNPFLLNTIYLIWLVVWTPLKIISQLGWLFPIYGKIKNVPNHQPVIYWGILCQKWCCTFLKECPTMLKECTTLLNQTLQKSNAKQTTTLFKIY